MICGPPNRDWTISRLRESEGIHVIRRTAYPARRRAVHQKIRRIYPVHWLTERHSDRGQSGDDSSTGGSLCGDRWRIRVIKSVLKYRTCSHSVEWFWRIIHIDDSVIRCPRNQHRAICRLREAETVALGSRAGHSAGPNSIHKQISRIYAVDRLTERDH